MNNIELYFLIENIGSFIGIGIIALMIAIPIIAYIWDTIENLIYKFKKKNKESER